jgi:hypothetical protein
MTTFKLNNPYPLNESIKDRLIKCVLFGLFVFLFLFVFRPFQIDGLQNYLLVVSFGYGFVCFAMMFILNILVFNAMPHYFTESKWTIKRELNWLVINLLMVGSANFVYSIFLKIADISTSSFFMFFGYTLAVGLFPITTIVLINYTRWNSKYEAESDLLNPIIEADASAPAHTIEISLIKFLAENGMLELEILPEHFLYAKADDNYVEVYHLMNEQKQRKVIRNSLKSIHAFLPTQINFYRCHKSYVINLDYVNHISGNAQGYKFHLKNTEELIPVSRSNNEFVKNYFTNRPKNTQIDSKSV